MTITVASCDGLSLPFLNAAVPMATFTICLQSLFSALQSPIEGLAAADAQPENCP